MLGIINRLDINVLVRTEDSHSRAFRRSLHFTANPTMSAIGGLLSGQFHSDNRESAFEKPEGKGKLKA